MNRRVTVRGVMKASQMWKILLGAQRESRGVPGVDESTEAGVSPTRLKTTGQGRSREKIEGEWGDRSRDGKRKKRRDGDV